MQTVISKITFTFVDDAIALATGFGRAVRYLTIDLLVAARARMMAPVDRLARSCDVANVLPARHAAMTRLRYRGSRWNGTPAKAPRDTRFAALNVFATFRSLRDLS
jgi:hypothetical protein